MARARTAALLACAALLMAAASALTFQVEPQSEECVYEDIEAGRTFKMNFEVIRGGLLDIQFRVYSPKNRVVFEKMAYFSKKEATEAGAEEGKVSFVAPFTGTYKICFDNTMSRWTAKVITFSVESVKAAKEEIAKLEHLGPVVDSVIAISENLEKIEKLQRQLRVREAVHRDIQESINRRVHWLAILETGLLLGMSVLSVMFIQKWFNTKGRVGGV